MTDQTHRHVEDPIKNATPLATPLGDVAPGPGARAARRRHSVAGGRIAAAGIGIAAMVGLVANMEVANGKTHTAGPAPSPRLAVQRVAKGVRPGTVAAPGAIAAAKVKRPIVLTPHVVVNTVSAPSSGGSSGGSYSGGSAPAYSAPVPAAAPVASSGGSH